MPWLQAYRNTNKTHRAKSVAWIRKIQEKTVISMSTNFVFCVGIIAMLSKMYGNFDYYLVSAQEIIPHDILRIHTPSHEITSLGYIRCLSFIQKVCFMHSCRLTSMNGPPFDVINNIVFFKLSCAETRRFQENWVSIMANDALASCITWALSLMHSWCWLYRINGSLYPYLLVT